MKTKATWREELEAIRRRPQFYLPGEGTEHLFTRFVAFWAGYEAGHSAAQHGFMTPAEFAPHGFHQFVADHFGCTLGGHGWHTLIRKYTASEEEAFELFFRLREEYERKRAA